MGAEGAIQRSTQTAGMEAAATTRKAVRLLSAEATAPSTRAAPALPSDCQRVLPPREALKRVGPKAARVTAAMAGVMTVAAAEWSSSAPITGTKPVAKQKAAALTPVRMVPAARMARFCATKSTRAPPGSWSASAPMVPMLRARPVSVWFQPAPMSARLTNGPNPVCIAAIMKL